MYVATIVTSIYCDLIAVYRLISVALNFRGMVSENISLNIFRGLTVPRKLRS